ncbi:MAG: hypothetical protein EoVTN8_522 [Fluviibacter phosphoraccumulans EoVTN8]
MQWMTAGLAGLILGLGLILLGMANPAKVIGFLDVAGPGLVLLGAGIPEGVIYVASLLAGMILHSLIEKLRHSA